MSCTSRLKYPECLNLRCVPLFFHLIEDCMYTITQLKEQRANKTIKDFVDTRRDKTMDIYNSRITGSRNYSIKKIVRVFEARNWLYKRDCSRVVIKSRWVALIDNFPRCCTLSRPLHLPPPTDYVPLQQSEFADITSKGASKLMITITRTFLMTLQSTKYVFLYEIIEFNI